MVVFQIVFPTDAQQLLGAPAGLKAFCRSGSLQRLEAWLYFSSLACSFSGRTPESVPPEFVFSNA
jgi:hypothetical protein